MFYRKAKRIKELEAKLEEALNARYELNKLFRDYYVNGSRSKEVINNLTAFQYCEDMEATMWLSENKKDEN